MKQDPAPQTSGQVLRGIAAQASVRALYCRWVWRGVQVRMAVGVAQPRLIGQLVRASENAAAQAAIAPFDAHEHTLRLLLRTVADPMLPLHWRQACLDASSRPLAALGALADSERQRTRHRRLAYRLATIQIA